MTEENNLPLNETEKRNSISMMHYIQLLNYITGFFGLVAVIIIWQLKKEEIPEIRKHAIEIINFQISWLLLVLISAALSVILIGIPFVIAFAILGIYAPVRGGTAVQRGEWYDYPLTFKFIS